MAKKPNGKSAGPSWFVVILLLIVFWPVGLFLLFRRITADKTAVLKNSKVFSIIGYLLLVCGVLGFIGLVGTGDSDSVIMLFMAVGGFLLTRYAKRMKKRGETYKRYIAMVVNQRLDSLDSIATAMDVEYDAVVTDLQAMIDLGYFGKAYLDKGARKIVLPGVAPQYSYETAGQFNSGGESGQTRLVTCPGCGAHNMLVEGTVCSCEYCGSPLA